MSDGTAGLGTYTYQWYAGGVAIIGEDDPTLVVASEYIGKTISVTVTNENGDTATSDETAPVTNDLSAEITLTDKNGLQTDGTALPDDVLAVSYGQDLGTPSTVIWWCNGAARAVYTTEGGALTNAFTSTNMNNTVFGGNGLEEGDWWVTIENTEGLTSVTNTITVAASHIAVMTDITITDDYATDGAANLDLRKTTTKSVVTVTLNKAYTGTFYLAPEKTTKFNSADLGHQIDVSTAVTARSKSKFTDAAALTEYASSGNALYLLDKTTGEITYKFPVEMSNTAADDIKRGSNYYLIFDQDDYENDDISTTTGEGDSDNLNMSDLVEVPYVVAPDSIEVTNYSKFNGAGATIKVTVYDEDGAALTWWDSAADTVANTAGLSDVSVYNIASNTASASDEACTLDAAAPVEASDGVFTITYTGTDTQYAYVKMTTTAGVFAEEEETLTTSVRETNAAPATSFKLEEDSSDPKAAVVKFENLTTKGSGTVYLFQSNANVSNPALNTDIAGQDKDGVWMVGSQYVEGGTTKVTIANVFNKNLIGDANNEDKFAALFVPDDQDSYASMTTATFTLEQKLKSYKLDGVVDGKTLAELTTTKPVILGVDQFGQSIDLTTYDGGNGSPALVLTAETGDNIKTFTNTTTVAAGPGTITTAVDAAGAVTIALPSTANNDATDPDYAKGTTYERTLAGGQTLKVTVHTSGDKVAGSNQPIAKFTVTVS